MCRNIKRLYNLAPPATEQEVRASALQFVRKVTGMAKPSVANLESVDRAVEEITAITWRLLQDQLQTHAPARDRELEAEQARRRGRQREARLRRQVLGTADGG